MQHGKRLFATTILQQGSKQDSFTPYALCWDVLWTFSCCNFPTLRECRDALLYPNQTLCRRLEVCVLSKTFHCPLSIIVVVYKFMSLTLISVLLIHVVSRSTAKHECVAVYPHNQWVCFPFCFLNSCMEHLAIYPSWWNQNFVLLSRRHDLTESLKELQCRTLIFVGQNSQFHAEAVHMTSKLDERYSALVEVLI